MKKSLTHKTLDNYSIRILPYKPGDEKFLIKLLHLTRSKTASKQHAINFWKWKHLNNPFGKSYGIYAWDKKKRMALSLRMLMRWSFISPDSRIIYALRAVDSATHPLYQRKGIFSVLTQRALKDTSEMDIHFIFNTPNPKTSLPGYLKLGWKIVGLLDFYTYSTHKKVRKQFSLTKGSVSWGVFYKKYKNQINHLIKVWENTRHGYRISKDLRYLKWRYGNCPHFEYLVYPYETNNRLSAFAILRENRRHKIKTLSIADIFLDKTESKFGAFFLNKLITENPADRYIAYFAHGTLEQKMLFQVGFMQKPDKPNIILTVRKLAKINPSLLNLKNWDFTLGDLELF